MYANVLTPSAVWRDALGPGYATGPGDAVLRSIAAASTHTYRASK